MGKNEQRRATMPCLTGSAEETGQQEKQAGFALLDVTIAAMVLAITFMSMANLMTSSVKTADRVDSIDSAAVLLEETLDSLAAQPFDALLTMNGNSFFSTVNSSGTSTAGAATTTTTDQAAARFRIDLSVTEVARNLLSIRTILIEQQSGKELTRVVTLRSRR